MKIHVRSDVDAAKVQRFLTAWRSGVEPEDMCDRFGLTRPELCKMLKKHGVVLTAPAPKPAPLVSRPRTGRWSTA